jgi:hypothetical protein
VSFLAVLSAEARAELAAFVREEIAADRRERDLREARNEWLSTTDVATLVCSSENAVRCRLRRGWLAGNVAKDGKRLLVRRSAVLDDLEARAARRPR